MSQTFLSWAAGAKRVGAMARKLEEIPLPPPLPLFPPIGLPFGFLPSTKRLWSDMVRKTRLDLSGPLPQMGTPGGRRGGQVGGEGGR